MTSGDAYVPLAITERSGVDESVHFGAVVALDRDGKVSFALGDPDVTIYPRSANKPMQAVAMLRAGLMLPPELLALVCASHDGTVRHRRAATEILASAGLDESHLGNTPDLPLDSAAARTVLREGGGPSRLAMNCSGKHSGMVATCAASGWPCDISYLEPRHPLQIAITDTLAGLAGEDVAHIGVDGCGAPAHTMSLTGLARCFRTIVTGGAGRSGTHVAAAMREHPEMVGGERRDVTQLMRHVPGLMAKDGAEGVYAAAMPDGRAVALKIADGASRARPPVMIAALARLGVDTSAAQPLVTQFVLGHGHPVGAVRAAFS
jgi:L-asparaginase II